MKKLLAILSVVLFANQASAAEFSFPINGKDLSLSSDLYCQDFDDEVLRRARYTKCLRCVVV